MSGLLRLTACTAVLFCFVSKIPAESETSRIPQLIEALDDENVRYGASIALTRLGKQAVPALRASLTSDKPDRRVWSAYTLGEIGPDAESAASDLTTALGSADPAFRAATARALGRIGPASAPSVGALAGLLRDEAPEVRRRSAVALGRIGPGAREAAPALIAALQDRNIREAVRAALIRIGKSTSSALQESLGDDKLRFDISMILLEVDPETAKRMGCDKPTLADVPSLRLALHDLTRSPRERTTAATRLASLGKEGFRVLIEAFNMPAIAHTAATAFAKTGSAAVAPLVDVLNHEQVGVRAAAADALGYIGPEANEAIPELVRLFEDRDHDVRYRAVCALDTFGQKAAPAVPNLVKVMLDPKQREPARQRALMVLVNTLPKTHDAVVEALIEATKDTNYGVSSLARGQVLNIDPQAAKAAGIR